MAGIVHKKIVEVHALCEDGSVMVVLGDGTLHINDNEIKTDNKSKVIKTRSLAIGMSVESEAHQ